MGADFSRICAWFVVNREAYGEGLRLFINLVIQYFIIMSKIISILIALTLSYGAMAQSSSAEQKFKTGEELYKNNKFKEALPYLTDAANSGHAEAQCMLGRMYYFGDGVASDYATAMKWFQKSAAQGYAKAYTNIALMYQFGDGVTQDYSTSMMWYMKAAELNNAGAQYAIGTFYYQGLGVPRDLSKGAEWYQKAAGQDFVLALDGLGRAYRDGSGVKQDYSRAIELFERAADKGEPTAQDDLGLMYEMGLGTKKDYKKAAEWYRKAADQGWGKSQFHLGNLYYNGQGVKKDYPEAAWLFQKAADKGVVEAIYNLGVMYENGHGVTKDISLAIEFYKKALDKNPSYELARNALNRYQPKEPNPSQPIPSDETTAPNTKTDEGITIDASGTGFIIDKRGYLATNNHVTKGARGIYVCLQIDGIWKSYNAVLVKNDPTNDLSIIRIEDTTFKPFSSMPYNFTTDVEEVASEIYTLGYPQVHIMGTEVKYTTGAINSKSGVQGDPTHYQISAHIDHGNSGGPMFNSKGTIIGITDSGLDKAEFGDVNYAIKSSYLKSLVDALPVKLELPHDTSIEKLSRVEQIKVLSKFTALILIDLP